VYRPWGSYDSVDLGPNYQVKRITVNTSARLSLQRHQHRVEHWVVVDGLANKTDMHFHLIEVQSGSYVGEDDIERLENLYGRC